MTRVPIPPNSYFTSMFAWLVKQYGPSGNRWYLTELSYINFKDSKDALLFLLRWS